jgi:ribonuclease G
VFTRILANVSPLMTRVAVTEDSALTEVYIERPQERGFVGNIYRGRVSNLANGMQAAFVDVGLEHDVFLPLSGIVPPRTSDDGAEETSETPAGVKITDILKVGQLLDIQIVKEPVGTKGARGTTNLTLPGRYLVLMPTVDHIGISRRIDSDEERERLRKAVEGLRDPGMGLIIRTVAAGKEASDFAEDIQYLTQQWKLIQQKSANAAPRALLYQDSTLLKKVVRDLFAPTVDEFIIDSRADYEQILQESTFLQPALKAKLKLYESAEPLFDKWDVEGSLEKALGRKVWLKSGAFLVIEETEALNSIDVNTGRFLGSVNLEETVFKTNLEAAEAIARQVRVRNLAGIIVIDFIDMTDETHRSAVLEEFRRARARDRTKMTVNGFTQLGLVEMTRKRTRESLAHVLCEPCPTCAGRGQVKTAHTICYEILRELLREHRAFNAREYRVLASGPVIDLFLEEESGSLAMLSDFIGKPVSVQVESGYAQEQYDIVLM